MKRFTSLKDVEDPGGLLALARSLKENPHAFPEAGKHKTLGILFFNPSLRTRMSTQKAAQNLGLQVMCMDFNQGGWSLEFGDGTVMNQGSQEHIKEAAAVISSYCDLIAIRTFAGLREVEEDYAETVLEQFIEHATVPVISLESATLHPLQSLADWMTIEEYRQVKRPKVVLTWAPHPKPLPQAVANSFLEWMAPTEVDLVVAHPPGLELAPQFLEGLEVVHQQDEALEGADFVYAKSWSSYTNYGCRYHGGGDWQITPAKMALTNAARFMHCLPIRRNVIAADQVLDSPQSLVIQQAENRTYAAQAVLLQMLQS